MIELRVEDYCQTCTNFTASTIEMPSFKKERVFVVICEKRKLCENIRKYLEEKTKGENSNERKTD